MFLTAITGGGAFPMLEKTLAFAEARNRMLANNIANIDTPGFRAGQLDVSAFQAALREASARRERPGDRFKLDESREIRTNELGHLETSPSLEPVDNLLFHDGDQRADRAADGGPGGEHHDAPGEHRVVEGLLRRNGQGHSRSAEVVEYWWVHDSLAGPTDPALAGIES